MSAYQSLEAAFGRVGAVEEAVAVLHWDQAAMMPAGGAAARAEQVATLRGIAHEMMTAPEIGDWLAAADNQAAALGPWQQANLREMRRRWRHASAVPGNLVAALSRACSESEVVWRGARPADDFASALPGLERVLALTREVAAAKAAALGTTPYEALLDQYEPGGSTVQIDALFAEIEGFLPDLLDEALARQNSGPPPPVPAGPFPIAAQRRAALALMRRIGFDFDHGRLDESAHPFCGGTPDDVRLTTRYDETDFGRALMGTLHETGHALYERGLPAEWRRQPVGRPRGMALHESQSLLLEMQVCRSRAFAEFAAPILREIFGGSGAAWEAEALYRRQIGVAPGLNTRRCRRGDLSGACDPALPVGAGDDRGRSLAARSAGRLGRGVAQLDRRRAGRRSRRLPAGHSLVRRRLGLFPDLYPGCAYRGAIVRRGPTSHSGY